MDKKKVWAWLGILGVFTVLLRAFAAYHAQVYFDGCGYIMHAWSIAQGKLSTPYWMAQMDHYYPPLYPALIYLFHFLVKSWPEAAKAVSLLFSALLLIPVFALARKMFYEEVGLLACALLVAYPILVIVGSNAYSEPVYLFFVGLSMLWGWQMVVEKRNLMAFLSGLALGLAYLARPQAVAGLPSLGLILFWFWLIQRQLKFSHLVRFLALVLVGFYLFALPYDLYNYKKDHIWGLRLRMEFFKKGYQFKEDLQWFIRERTLNRNATDLLTFELARNNSPVDFVRNHPRIYLGWVKKDFKLVMQREFVNHKLSSPIISIGILFLILGLTLGWEKRLRNSKPHFYLLLWYLPIFFIVPLSISVLDRYFIPLTLCLSIWAGAGVEGLRSRLQTAIIFADPRGRKLFSEIGIWLIPLLLLHPQSEVRSLLFKKQVYIPEEQQWLVKTLGGQERKIMMSPDPFPALYSGNYWLMLPIDNLNRVTKYVRAQKPDYLVTDNHFFLWLEAPHDYFDQFLSPFSKPGLQFLAREKFKIKDPEGDKYFKTDAIYKVDLDQSTSLKPYNIILISIDALRADHLSCYGYGRNTSPNLDRIAAQGVRFEKAISQAPKTAPSHMTMFTSLYPEIHGVHKLYSEESFFSLDATWKTLPEILKGYGYHTAAFTGGGQVGKGFGFERGFDRYTENLFRLKWADFEPIRQWLDQVPQDEPFFLFLHTYQVHDPYLPPPPYDKVYDPDYDGWIISDWDKLQGMVKDIQKITETKRYISIHTLYWGQKEFKGDDLDQSRITPRDAEHYEALYDGGIAYTDQLLGRFLAELEQKKILNNGNTILIIVSDHGEEFREHDDFLHKRLYRETMGVPMIFYFPGVVPQGKVNKGQVRLLDLSPTILDLIGAPIPVQMQGVSLKDGILNGKDIFLSAYSEDSFIKKQYALRTRNLFYYLREGERKEEFYLESSDPNEKNNLLVLDNDLEDFIQKAPRYAKMAYKSYRKAINSFHFYNKRYKDIFEITGAENEKVKLGPEQIEKLRALGYIK